MVKFSMCNELFEGWSLDRTLKRISALGYNGVEIAPYTIAESVLEISDSARNRIANSAKRSGLEVAGIHWVLKRTKGLHLTSVDPEVRQRTKEYLKDLVEFCRDISGRVIVFGSPDQRTVPREAKFEEAWGWAVDTFRECSEHASKHDVIICIEPLRREGTNFVNTVDEALKLIRNVDHKNFRLILDMHALSGEEEPIDSLITKGKDFLEHFHANDDNKRGPGFGNIDLKKVAETLKKIGFNGFVSVEVLISEQNPEEAAKLSIENLRRVFT